MKKSTVLGKLVDVIFHMSHISRYTSIFEEDKYSRTRVQYHCNGWTKLQRILLGQWSRLGQVDIEKFWISFQLKFVTIPFLLVRIKNHAPISSLLKMCKCWCHSIVEFWNLVSIVVYYAEMSSMNRHTEVRQNTDPLKETMKSDVTHESCVFSK